MNDRTILALKTSWSYVLRNAEEAGEVFYQKLFELDPTLRPLFPTDVTRQAKKLVDMVTLVISRLQKLDDIRHEVEALGQRHVGYGTRPEHYKTVGDALLWTLEQGLDDRWDDEIREAWTEVYQMLSDTMLRGAAKLPPVPASEV